MIGPLLRVAATTLAARSLREAVTQAANRALLMLAAALGGIVAAFCFTRAALALLERSLDPAAAWTLVGGFYGLAGGALYVAASRRSRAAVARQQAPT